MFYVASCLERLILRNPCRDLFVGALGSFAAGTEFAFGTILQRVMSFPGRARFHYGHPDVWDKLWVMTRGGVSKASRNLHVSEDVFGGFNAGLRGGKIAYRDYLSVGAKSKPVNAVHSKKTTENIS